MKRTRLLTVCTLILAFAVCLSLTACGDKGEPADTEPPASSAGTELVFTTPVPDGTPAPEDSEPVGVPEPTSAPVTISLRYDGSTVTSLSFQTSTVFQLQAVTSDGSAGGTWTSSDGSIASVDENGFVTCWKGGSVTITYTQGDASASCSVAITQPTVRIYYAGAEKNDISISGAYGWEVPLTAVVTPEGSTVTWSSDDPNVASVSEDGLVTARQMGVTTIHAKCGTADAACIIRVTGVPPVGLAIPVPEPTDNTPRIVITYLGEPDPNFTIRVGETWDMDYALYNIDPGAAVSWSVGDPDFATVDEQGRITALKATFGAFPGRNFTTLKVTCGEFSYESVVFIRNVETLN